MTASGTTPGSEVVAVKTVLGGILLQPDNCRHDVIDLGGVDRVAGESISQACDGVALFEVTLSDRETLLTASLAPAAAMNPEDYWNRLIACIERLREEQIELLALMPVLDVGQVGKLSAVGILGEVVLKHRHQQTGHDHRSLYWFQGER